MMMTSAPVAASGLDLANLNRGFLTIRFLVSNPTTSAPFERKYLAKRTPIPPDDPRTATFNPGVPLSS